MQVNSKFYTDLYRQYDKITSKEIIFHMNTKIQHKYDKLTEQFLKVSRDYSIHKEKAEELFMIIERKITLNDYEDILILFIK